MAGRSTRCISQSSWLEVLGDDLRGRVSYDRWVLLSWLADVRIQSSCPELVAFGRRRRASYLGYVACDADSRIFQ